MTTPFTLGRLPTPLSVVMSPGAMFESAIKLVTREGASALWPEGTQMRLDISREESDYLSSWPFTVSGDMAYLSISAEDISTMPARSLHAQLWLNYGDGWFLWCAGDVDRYA